MLRLYIEPQWGSKPLLSVKAAVVRAWLLKLDLSAKTKSHIHGLMKRLFTFAMLWEWYPQSDKNPMSLFFIPGGSKREKEPRVLTPEQFAKLLEIVPEPYRTMIIVSMCLGLRCSEMVGLRWADIDFLAEVIFIRRAVVEGRTGNTKTPPSKARLPLDPQLAAVFKAYHAVAICKGQRDWVFASPRTAGEKPLLPNNVQYTILRPAGKAIGLDFNLGWHTFRHTYKSWMDRVGATLVEKRDLMRHADAGTTENIYGEVTMDQMREVNAKVVTLARIM
jgi:integrase